MTLLSDGKNAFFAERGRTFFQSLIIHLPENCALFFNDICYLPKNGAIYLPLTAIRQGENSVALRKENRILPTENLYFDGEAISPVGLSTEALLLRQNERMTALEDTLILLSCRIGHLEERCAAKLLFS